MEMIDAYKMVLKDCVACYLENLEDKDREKITDRDINSIVVRLVYENEHIWDVINDVIGVYVNRILKERGEK